MSSRARATKKSTGSRKGRYWSAEVTRRSNALDLEPAVFRKTPRAMAASLKRSAERSRRRKSEPYLSAMSMLNFYINRAGRGLSATRRAQLERAKQELRRLYGREPRRAGRSAAQSGSVPRRRSVPRARTSRKSTRA
jgi:hypothetical protein